MDSWSNVTTPLKLSWSIKDSHLAAKSLLLSFLFRFTPLISNRESQFKHLWIGLLKFTMLTNFKYLSFLSSSPTFRHFLSHLPMFLQEPMPNQWCMSQAFSKRIFLFQLHMLNLTLLNFPSNPKDGNMEESSVEVRISSTTHTLKRKKKRGSNIMRANRNSLPLIEQTL